MSLKSMVLLLGLVLAAPGGNAAEAAKFPAPGPRDTCPVCGMFVAKYPEWIATVVYGDGHAHHFDGAKDMFKFLHDPARYHKGDGAAEIVAIGVTEYYGVQRIDARTALYVIGSDVYGPMGRELIPFATRAEAEEFLADHQGRAILGFEQVTPEVVRRLDEGDPR